MRLSSYPSGDAKARAVAWLTAWDSQGAHRTATRGVEAGAVWLAHEAAGLGAEVATEVFALDRLDPVACYLELDGKRIPAVPTFDAPPTGAKGVTGILSRGGDDQAILVAELAPRSVYTGEYEKLRRDAAHRAVVIVCTGARPGMGLLNAELFRNPYGAPAIHVSSADLRRLAEAELARAGRHRAQDACAQRRAPRHPSRRRSLPHLGWQQSAVPSAAGPNAARGRPRHRDTRCNSRSRFGREPHTLSRTDLPFRGMADTVVKPG
jgi:hypothetical protein